LGEDEEEEDEEEGDIFTEKSAVQPPGWGDTEVVEEMAKPPEKKVLTHTDVCVYAIILSLRLVHDRGVFCSSVVSSEAIRW